MAKQEIAQTPKPKKIKWCQCHGTIPEHRERCR